MEIPIPYQVIIGRMNKIAYEGKIEVNRARNILTYLFRMPRDKVFAILNEMKRMKLIEFENKWYIRIIYKELGN